MIVFANARDHFAEAFFPRRSEWAGAALLLLGGWVLSANPDLTSTSQGKAFDLMKATTQPTRSSLLVFGSCLRLLVLAINGAGRRSPHLRVLAAILAGFFWWQIAASYYAGPQPTPPPLVTLRWLILGCKLINRLLFCDWF